MGPWCSTFKDCRLRAAVIEPRIYRAAFVPALLAVVLTMFSFQSRPRPLPQGLAADVLFDGNQAAELAARIAAEAPDRRAGSRGDLATAQLVADTFATRGFAAAAARARSMQRFTHAGHELVNVVGRRAGSSRRQIVIVAARDAATRARGARQRRGHGRAHAARPRLPGAAVREDAGAGLGGRLEPRRGGRPPARGGAAGAGAGGRRARDLGPRLARRTTARSSRRGRTTRPAPASASSARSRTRSGRSSATPAGAAGRSGSSRGCRSRSGSARRASCWSRATTPCASPAAGSCRRTARPVRGDRPGPARSLGRATLRTLTAVDEGPRPEHGPEELHPGGEPGAARLGAVAAGGLAAPARAGGVGGRVRARAGAGTWTCSGGCAGSARGSRRSSPRSRWRSSSRWWAPRRRRPPRRCRRTSCRSTGRRSGCWPASPWRWSLAFVLARWLASPAGPRARCSELDLGAGVALGLMIAAGSLLLWLVNPYAGLLVGARGAPLDAARAHPAAAAAARARRC